MVLFLNQASIKHLIYLIVIACATVALNHYLHPAQPFWLIFSAFTLSLISLDDTSTGSLFQQRIIVLLLTGLCAILATFLSAWLALSFPILTIYLFALTCVCVYLGQLNSQYFLSAFLVNLFALLSAAIAVADSTLAERAILITTGFAIVITAQIIVVPYLFRDAFRFLTLQSIQHLKALNREIFSCFLYPEYSTNIYLFERRLHNQKNKFMQAIVSLRKLGLRVKTQNAPDLNSLISHLDLIYDTLLDCSQLRRRVTDFTIFSVCSQELTAISQAIERALTDLSATAKPEVFAQSIANLREKIHQLENINQNVLQVTAREPLAFILFIASLKALCDEISKRPK